jgi:hypothetical protein
MDSSAISFAFMNNSMKYVYFGEFLDQSSMPETSKLVQFKSTIKSILTIDSTVSSFNELGGNTMFKSRLSSSLGLGSSDIEVVSVQSGSVIINYNIQVPSGTNADELRSLQET